MSRSAVSRWLRAGRVHRIYHDVYAVGHLALTPRSRLVAALFYAGKGAALSHRSAAWWWGLIGDPPAEIHVSVPRRKQPAHGIALHHPRRLERVLRHRLPVTPVARTLLDFATDASLHEVRKALAEADYRELLVHEELDSALGQGRPGSGRLRKACAAHLPELAKTETPLEDEFMLLCERHGLPIPEPNVWIDSYRVDALWRDERVVVELDGLAAHSSAARRLTDHRRDLKLRSWGYVVRRYSWHQVVKTPTAVAADARRTLTGRGPAAGAARLRR